MGVFSPSPNKNGTLPDCPPPVPTPCFSPEKQAPSSERLRKYMQLQRSPPSTEKEMQSLRLAVLQFFEENNRSSATVDELAMAPRVKSAWKAIGRIPLWKLLKQFPHVLKQQQQPSGVWLITLDKESALKLKQEQESLAAAVGTDRLAAGADEHGYRLAPYVNKDGEQCALM